MTEEYKENVLKYLTNNLLEQSGIQAPKYDSITNSASSIYTELGNYFTGMIIPIGFVPPSQNSDNKYSIFAFNGTLIGASDTSGALVILDSEYNIVEVLTTYSDGATIGVIQCINIDEEGNYFLIEQVSSNYRIVLLNNVVMKPVGSNTHQAIKVATYTIPNQYTWTSMCKIFKNDKSDKYFAVATRSAGVVGIYLEVGNTNKWAYYTSTYTIQTSEKMFTNGFNVYWDNGGTLQFQIASYDNGLIMLSKGSTTTMDAVRLSNKNFEETGGTLKNYDFVFYSNKIGYLLEVEEIDLGSTPGMPSGYSYPYTISKIDIENKIATTIYQGKDASNLHYQRCWTWLLKKNNLVFYYDFYTVNGTDYFVKFNVIDNVKVYTPQSVGTFSENVWLYAWIYPNVIVDYNKVYVYLLNNSNLAKIELTWNPDNYCGLPYESITSLIPRYATIEDENEVELYNRNLYNLTAYSNGYNATLQVPNSYLNGVELTNAQLYSQNNNLLVGNPITTEKNEYEELFINFINRFNVLNDGTINISASNGLVSSMLNKSTTGHLGKIKINYKDNTNSIGSLTTQNLVYTYTSDGIKTTLSIMVYTSKLIDNIELLSEDETISYSTIDCSNLELNKYYLITQDVRID